MSAKRQLCFDNDTTHQNTVDRCQRNKTKRARTERKRLSLHKMKRTNDDVHSTIDICPIMDAIMRTPQFGRLKKLKQLGTAEHVYVNVTHNRKEHSLGVAHLADRMCRRIKERQPGLGCTEKDVLCVKLAGLLHDIGHGPFSHVYETFVTEVFPKHLKTLSPEHQEYYESLPAIPRDWRHEYVSLDMIDALLAHLGLEIDLNNLDAPLKEVGDSKYAIEARSLRLPSKLRGNEDDHDKQENTELILTSRDFVFIKECIWGKPIQEISEKLGCTGFVGRPNIEQEWLYSIVNNPHSGLDVDKVDYYARDQRHAFRGAGEIDKIVVEEAVVAWGSCTDPEKCPRCKQEVHTNNKNDSKYAGRHLMVCYPEKVKNAAMSFFKTRFYLHKLIYRHKTTQAVAYMITDILKFADPYYRVPVDPPPVQTYVPTGKPKTAAQETGLPISRAMLDSNAFLQLTDSVIDSIKTCRDSNPDLAEARALVFRLDNRDFYTCVASESINVRDLHARKMWAREAEQIKQEMLQVRGKHGNDEGGSSKMLSNLTLHHDDFIVEKCNIHHGQKSENPVNHMRFLEKEQMAKAKMASTIYELPEAVQLEEYTYEAQLPRSLEENCLRIYSRHEEKDDLVSHVFHQWLEVVRSGVEISATVTMSAWPEQDQFDKGVARMNDGSKEDGEEEETQPPALLTQDSEDEDDEDYDTASPYFMGRPSHSSVVTPGSAKA